MALSIVSAETGATDAPRAARPTRAALRLNHNTIANCHPPTAATSPGLFRTPRRRILPLFDTNINVTLHGHNGGCAIATRNQRQWRKTVTAQEFSEGESRNGLKTGQNGRSRIENGPSAAVAPGSPIEHRPRSTANPMNADEAPAFAKL